MASDLESGLVIIIFIFLFYVFITVSARGYNTNLPFGCNIYTKVSAKNIHPALDNYANQVSNFSSMSGMKSGGGVSALRKIRHKGWFCRNYNGTIYDTAVADTNQYNQFKSQINASGWEEYYEANA